MLLMEQTERNLALINRLAETLGQRGHDPQMIDGVIHHLGSRYTNLWVMPQERRQGRGKLTFQVLRIGICGRDVDQMREYPDPHDATTDQLAQWVADWMKQFPEEPQRRLGVEA